MILIISEAVLELNQKQRKLKNKFLTNYNECLLMKTIRFIVVYFNMIIQT